MTKDNWYHWWDPKAVKMRKIVRKVTFRIGRRGAYLLFLALLDFIFGWSLISDPGPVGLRPDLFFNYPEWAWAWIFVGAICLWQAFVRLDRLAYSLAVTIKILWGVTALISWTLTATNPRGWVSAAIFIGFGFLTAIVSFWPEQQRTLEGKDRWGI